MNNTLQVYFFSGTGNSKRVTQWICNEAGNLGTESESFDISKQKPVNFRNETTLIFISPTHGFNYPPVVINYLLRFPKTTFKNKVYLMNTRAGMKLSKIFLPGFSGIALWFAALILLLKGYRISGMRSIDLPSNWISLHPGLRRKVVDSMFNHYEKITRDLTDKIIRGRKIFRFSLIIGMPLDIIITPVAIGYYFVGRFVLAKTFMASSFCDNCGLCIKKCPIQAISLKQNRPYWSYRCESCMRCMNNCPKRAIETTHGMLAAIIFLTYAVVLASFYRWIPINHWKFSNLPFLDSFTKFFIESAILFLLLIVTYRLVHFLKRFRWFDYIIVYTSLTKLPFWRRYKSPSLKKQ